MAAERERIQGDQGGPAVTISFSAIGETLAARRGQDALIVVTFPALGVKLLLSHAAALRNDGHEPLIELSLVPGVGAEIIVKCARRRLSPRAGGTGRRNRRHPDGVRGERLGRNY
jgi:hypothetical protein